MVTDAAFIFHICIPCGKNFSVMSRSSAKVKVEYQGHIH